LYSLPLPVEIYVQKYKLTPIREVNSNILKGAAYEELGRERARDPRNAKKSRKELGLKKFSETEIRASVLKAPLIITKGIISKQLKVDEFGMYYRDTNNKTIHLNVI
jgi:hypothetical protein